MLVARWLGERVNGVAVLGPVRETLPFGQIGVFLAALVLLDLALLGRGHPPAGLGIGLAAAVKITPAFFVLYLLITRRWRAAGTATAVAAVVSVASIAAGPGLWWRYWTDLLWQTDRVGSLGSGRNQLLAGLLTRLQNGDGVHPGTAHPELLLWATAAALVLVVGLWRARRARGGHHYDDGLIGVLGENAYVLGCLALLVLTPVRQNWPTLSAEDWHSDVGRSAPTVAV